ncbi:hypothetical protein [Dysgonomonas sp. ZJ709]|nr:hypothetical protein [Dysgonomonas sp. ZJ709]
MSKEKEKKETPKETDKKKPNFGQIITEIAKVKLPTKNSGKKK